MIQISAPGYQVRLAPPPQRASFADGSDGLAAERLNQTYPTAYRGATLQRQELYAWRPPFTSGESSTLYDRFLAGVRADDLARNDPHANAGITRLVDMLVGPGLRVAPRPMARALGLDTSKAADRAIIKDLAQALKSEWHLFAHDPRHFNDAQRRFGLNTQLRLMSRTWQRRGEATAFLKWRPDDNARYATCIRVVDPDRLCNPYGQPDGPRLRGGVEYTADGEPVAYWLRNAHPADWFKYAEILKWTKIARQTVDGRPIFIHGMEPDREDQSRAMTPFASLMSRLHMIGKFADTELANATINALFAAFVKSDMPIADAAASFSPAGMTWADKREAFYQRNPAFLNGVRIPFLPPGDEIKINSSPRQTTAFPHFQTAFLQSIAASLGISYEQLSMDWSKVNYSSARAALNEVWRHIQSKFAVFVEQIVSPIYYAVMEEAFDRGYVKVPPGCPDFWEMPAAYLSARWIGPGRGYVDPVKEVQGATMRMSSLVSTLEDECAESGKDWEDVLDQAAAEEDEIKARGFVRVISSTGRMAVDPTDDPDAAGDGDQPEQLDRSKEPA